MNNGVVTQEPITEETAKNFAVKPLNEFIREDRYRHVSLFFSPKTTLRARLVHGYELLQGKQFDTQYTGLFAFGILDLSLVTIMASYLWRVAVNEQIPLALRITAGVAAAPVILAKMIISLAAMLVLALPIAAYHEAVTAISELTDEVEYNESVVFAV